jgi:hypothetical protein
MTCFDYLTTFPDSTHPSRRHPRLWRQIRDHHKKNRAGLAVPADGFHFEGQSEAAIHTMEVGFTLIRVRFAHMPVALQIAPGEVEQLYGRDLQLEDIRAAAFNQGNAQNHHSEVTLTNVSCSDVPSFYRGNEAITAPSRHYIVDRFALGLEIGGDGRERGVSMRHQKHKLSQPAPMPPSDLPVLPPMDQWVNVRTLDVIGDGKSDDTAALRAGSDRNALLDQRLL